MYKRNAKANAPTLYWYARSFALQALSCIFLCFSFKTRLSRWCSFVLLSGDAVDGRSCSLGTEFSFPMCFGKLSQLNIAWRRARKTMGCKNTSTFQLLHLNRRREEQWRIFGASQNENFVLGCLPHVWTIEVEAIAYIDMRTRLGRGARFDE